jgi:hypothetical protein
VLAVPVMRNRPVQLIMIGFFMIFLPWLYYLLLVSNIIVIKNSTLGFILLFVGFTAGVAGLFLGIIGTASYYSLKRKK